MAIRSSQMSEISINNAASLGSYTLDEYFTSFVRFKVFVNQLLAHNASSDLKGKLVTDW